MSHVIRVRPPCATKRPPSECPKNLHTFLGSFFGYIPASTCRRNRFGPIIVGCGRAKKVPLGCTQRCANLNSEKSQPQKTENYELSKRSRKQLPQLFLQKKNIFHDFWDQSSPFLSLFDRFLPIMWLCQPPQTPPLVNCVVIFQAKQLAYRLAHNLPEQALIS
jgi:hypothetical protein